MRPGSWLVLDHWTWLGYCDEPWLPWDLLCDLVPLTRRWIAAAGLPVTEVQILDLAPRWWMLLLVR